MRSSSRPISRPSCSRTFSADAMDLCKYRRKVTLLGRKIVNKYAAAAFIVRTVHKSSVRSKALQVHAKNNYIHTHFTFHISVQENQNFRQHCTRLYFYDKYRSLHQQFQSPPNHDIHSNCIAPTSPRQSPYASSASGAPSPPRKTHALMASHERTATNELIK